MMTEVCRRHERDIVLRAGRVCGPNDAADVAQEVFLRLWRNPAAFDPDKGSLETYLSMLARSIAVDSVRSDVRRRQRDARALVSFGPVDFSSDRLVYEPFVRKEVILRVGSALGDIRRWRLSSRTSTGISGARSGFMSASSARSITSPPRIKSLWFPKGSPSIMRSFCCSATG